MAPFPRSNEEDVVQPWPSVGCSSATTLDDRQPTEVLRSTTSQMRSASAPLERLLPRSSLSPEASASTDGPREYRYVCSIPESVVPTVAAVDSMVALAVAAMPVVVVVEVAMNPVLG